MKVLFGVFLFFIVGLNACQSQPDHEPIEALVFSDLITNDKHGVILDVRTPAEFEEGHIPGAINMDYYEDNFEAELKKLDKNTAYYVYCTVGGRSGSVAKLMHANGFTKFHDLKGGIDAWETNGLPITLSDD